MQEKFDFQTHYLVLAQLWEIGLNTISVRLTCLHPFQKSVFSPTNTINWFSLTSCKHTEWYSKLTLSGSSWFLLTISGYSHTHLHKNGKSFLLSLTHFPFSSCLMFLSVLLFLTFLSLTHTHILSLPSSPLCYPTFLLFPLFLSFPVLLSFLIRLLSSLSIDPVVWFWLCPHCNFTILLYSVKHNIYFPFVHPEEKFLIWIFHHFSPLEIFQVFSVSELLSMVRGGCIWFTLHRLLRPICDLRPQK